MPMANMCFHRTRYHTLQYTNMEIFNLPVDSMTRVVDDFLAPRGITIEEGIVLGRVFNKNTIDSTKAGVNVAESSLQQSLWNGQYQVKLLRGFGIPAVYCTGTFGRGAHEQEGLVFGESVCVMWANRNSMSVPIILRGSSLDFYQKLLTGNGHLLDCGEKIYRAAISKKPEVTWLPGFPFADNQTDNPQTVPSSTGSFTQNPDKLIKTPGGELFCDKFGRVLLTSRHLDHEFLVTIGKTDSGQDASSLTTKAAQNSYYGKIENDESEPINANELFAVKSLNLGQYQLIQQQITEGGNQETAGYLPRFDLWKFQPIIIRQFDAGTDGSKLSGDVYSVYQLRGNATDGNAYAFTVTQKGDVKEFVPRHVNMRVVGDLLVSVGNTCNFRVRKSGSSDATFDFAVKQNGDTLVQTKTKLAIESQSGIYVGGENGSEKMMMGESFKTMFEAFLNQVFVTWVPIPMDGGLALKTLFMTWFAQYMPQWSVTNKYLSDKNYVSRSTSAVV